MKALSKSVLVVSLLLPTVVHAKIMLQSKLSKIASQVAKTKKPITSKATNCSNFTGHWAGVCTDRNDTQNVVKSEIIIEQEACGTISIDNIPVPNHGSFSGQVSHHIQDEDNVNVAAIISGSWNPSQTRFTEVNMISVPAFGINILDSRFLELDGEQLIVSDGEHSVIISEDGNPPAGGWTAVKRDCRYSKQP